MANVYQNLVSQKSRRLRTVGLALLVSVLLMAGYGVFSLMPTLRAEKERYAVSHPLIAGKADHSREGKILATQILFATGYWSACGVLVLSLLTVAWLDVREVTRNYALQRRQLWSAESDGDPDKPLPS